MNVDKLFLKSVKMENRYVYIRGNPYYNGNMSETYFML